MPHELRPSNSLVVFFLPSARDIIFILLFWSILAGPLSKKPLADADIGWHIRTGEQILATQSIPHADSFSSTMHGQPWFAWEWLYDLTLGILHRAMGLNGVVLLCALLVSATMTVLLGQLVRTGTGLPLAIALMLLAELAAAIHLYARPHIVSWLLTLVWLIALDRWELGSAASPPLRKERVQRTPVPSWLPWFFPISMVLWVNLHGGWIFGLVVLAAYAIAAAIESFRGADVLARIRARQRARRIGLALIWSAVATLANPHGWRLHAHIYRYLGDWYLMNKIDEFRSPDFHGWSERAFALLLVLTMLALVSRRRSVGTSHVLLVLLAAYTGLYASRNLPVASIILVLVAGPILWESLTTIAERPSAWRRLRALSGRLTSFAERMDEQELRLRGHFWPALAVIAALALCLHGGRVGSRQLMRARFDPEHLPVKAADYLAQEQSSLPVFAPDSWGGYLIYRLYPNRQIVMDDRHDLYGSDRVRDYLVLVQVGPGWRDVLSKWQIRTVVFPKGSTLAGILRELAPEWKVVYEDKLAVVIEKKAS
jgi:hypothetical protein